MFPETTGWWTDYLWLVVCGAMTAFMMAWSIGANDVANSFATSVGAKTITLWQACIIATFMEFAGAVSLGGEVTRTISGGIARPAAFYDFPELFAYGMLCALVSATCWVTIATYFGLAVSTTHSIIGAVMGFAFVWGGGEAIVWNDKIDKFPFRTGLVPIIISWFASPTFAAVAAALLFFLTRLLILRRANSTALAYWALPPLVFITIFINLFFVLYKGASKELKWEDSQCGWVAAVVAAGCAVATIPVVFWLKYRDSKKQAEDEAAAAKQADAVVDVDLEAKKQIEVIEAPTTFWGKVKAQAIKGLTADVHEDVEQDEDVARMHQDAEVFEPQTEQVFKYLQVFSACCVSYSHGANDVANAVGPFAAIWFIYRNYRVSSNSETPKWILALGGAGIVIGLGTYGYNIMKTLGVKMARMTPSRGYCAELATALVISVASVYGMPISTTQCIVGAEMGVGLVDNLKTGANFKLFGKTFAGWVFTIIIAAIVSAALFAQGSYAPSIIMSREITEYQTLTMGSIKSISDTLKKANDFQNKTYGRSDSAIASSVKRMEAVQKNATNYRSFGHISVYEYQVEMETALKVYTSNTVPTVGYDGKSATFEEPALTVPKKSS